MRRSCRHRGVGRTLSACCMLVASTRAAWSLIERSSCTEAVSEPLFVFGLREPGSFRGVSRGRRGVQHRAEGDSAGQHKDEKAEKDGHKETASEAEASEDAASEGGEAAGSEVKDEAAAAAEEEEEEEEDAPEPKAAGAEKKLTKAKDEAAAGLAAKMDSIIRLQAELANYRRDHETELGRVQSLGKQDALRALLPLTAVIDEAGEAAGQELPEKEQQLHKSFSLLFGQIKNVFDKFGATQFEPEIGEAYDATKHKYQEFREPGPGEQPGSVVEVLTPGWQCDGSILVPSTVVIAQKAGEEGPKAAASSSEADSHEDEDEEEDMADEEEEEEEEQADVPKSKTE